MNLRACVVINWKYIAKSKTWMQIFNGFEVNAKTDASQQTVLARLVLI